MKFIKSFELEKDALEYTRNNPGVFAIVLSNKYEIYLDEE